MNRGMCCIALFTVLLSSFETTSARKDAGEFRKTMMKDQKMFEPSSKKKGDCHGEGERLLTRDFKPVDHQERFIKDFDQEIPNVSIYDNGIKSDHEKILAKDFESSEGATSYGYEIKPANGEKKFIKDFGGIPNEIYDNGIKPNDHFIKDFEEIPNVSIYDNGVEPGHKKVFAEDFEPEPNVSIYKQ